MKKTFLKKTFAVACVAVMTVGNLCYDFGGNVKVAKAAPFLDSVADVNYGTIVNYSRPFGIVCNRLEQNMHMETTMAVNTYKRLSNVNEIDLCGTGNVRLVIGDVEMTPPVDDGQKFHFGQIQHNDKITVETTSDVSTGKVMQEYEAHSGSAKNTADVNYELYTQAEINAKVNCLIQDMKDTSATLATKTTIEAADITTDAQGRMKLDGYGAKVVYVNVNSTDTDFIGKISSPGQYKILKDDDTVIVFNVHASSMAIGKGEFYLSSAPDVSIPTDQTFSGNDSPQNVKVDEEICRKVVWNLIDTTSLTLDTTAGIYLLPDATSVTNITNGSAGWLISAGTVTNTGEYHYIYHGTTDLGTTPSTHSVAPVPDDIAALGTGNTQTVMDPILLFKYFSDSKVGSADDIHSGAFFTLYTDAACTDDKAVSDASNVEALWNMETSRYEVKMQSTLIPPGATYYLKEVKAPDGFKPSENVFDCIIADDGSVTYKIHGDSASATDTFPNCTNSKVSEATGRLEVKITDKNTGKSISGAKVNIDRVDTKKTVLTAVTDSNGRIPSVELPVGDYIVKTVLVPTGYTAPDAVTLSVKTDDLTTAELVTVTVDTADTADTTDTVETTYTSKDVKTADSVATGDDMNLILVVFTMVAAVAVFAILRNRREDI